MVAAIDGAGVRGLIAALTASTDRPCVAEADWEVVLPAAEHARLAPRLAAEALQPDSRLPFWVRDRLISASIRGREFERLIRWEVNRVHRALHGTGIPVVFLKGAGYVAASLPIAVGRAVADIDVLVDMAHLPSVEERLSRAGWETVALSPYDERYYRRWMHELPPMRHRDRGTVLDVHHAILPRTSRIQPDSRHLLARAVSQEGTLTLCPTHMVLHAAAHLFHDGEIGGALRDVVDVDGMLRTFSADPEFWDLLARDADELGLWRPLYYAVRYAERLLGTPVPHAFWDDARKARPPAGLLALMDLLVTQTLGGGGKTAPAASFALYVRSHWLRMPPLMLARHLLHQATTR